MPHTNTWESHGVVKCFQGFVSAEEFIASVEEVAADRHFDDLRYIINDFLAIDDHNIDARVCEPIAAVRFGSMQTNPNFRVVVLTAEPRLLALVDAVNQPPLRGSHETRAFADMASAREWLAKQPRQELFSKYVR